MVPFNYSEKVLETHLREREGMNETKRNVSTLRTFQFERLLHAGYCSQLPIVGVWVTRDPCDEILPGLNKLKHVGAESSRLE